MPTNDPLLDVQGVSAIFSGRSRGGLSVVAVDDVSLSLPGDRATLLTLVGESGSGKTTLARTILGLLPPTHGSIRYKNKDIYQLSGADWQAYRHEVQPVFQDPYATYNPFYRIDRVLEKPVQKFKMAASRDEARAKIEEALKAVDLRPGDVLGRYPHQLSGGERQRIMLARIYLIRPRLIIADEPLSMIDASLTTLFLNILLDFRDNYGISCLFITHNLATAYYLGGDIAIMCRGRLIEQGDMDTVIAKPAHPYTQLLVASVPAPDPDKRWHDKRDRVGVESSDLIAAATACVFAARCPYVMPACRQQRPTLLDLQPRQQAACFLYDKAINPEAKMPLAPESTKTNVTPSVPLSTS
jgi:peptide/nickel transport system ATP-binding protein